MKAVSKIQTILDEYVLPAFFVFFVFVLTTVILVQFSPFDIYKDQLVQSYTDLVYMVLSILFAFVNFFIHPTQFNQNFSNLVLVILKLFSFLGGSIDNFVNGIFQIFGMLLRTIFSFIPVLGNSQGVYNGSYCYIIDSVKNVLSGVQSCPVIFDPNNTNNFNLGANNLSGNLLASKYIFINEYDLSTLTFNLGIYIDIIGVSENVTFSSVFQVSLLGTSNIGAFGILITANGSLPLFGSVSINAGLSIIDALLKPFKDYSDSLGSWRSIFQQLQAV